MKIRNPVFIDPAAAFVAANKAGITSFFQSRAAQSSIDFDEVRAAFPALAVKLTDGMICAICDDLGVEVEA